MQAAGNQKGRASTSRPTPIDWPDVTFKAFCFLILAYLVLPVIFVIPTAFTESFRITFPPQGFSLKWFHKFFTNSLWINAFKNSLIIAVSTCVISIGLAIPTALAFRKRFRGKFTLRLLVLMPWFVPEILIGIGLLMFVPKIGLYGNYLSVIIAHTLWGLPISFLIISTGLNSVDPALEEAAQTMGSSGLRVFFEITAPLIKNALISAVLFCFVLSFNEFVMSYFLCTPDIMTLPINIWSLLRTGFSPIVAASSTVVIVITLAELVLIARFIGFQTLYK